MSIDSEQLKIILKFMNESNNMDTLNSSLMCEATKYTSTKDTNPNSKDKNQNTINCNSKDNFQSHEITVNKNNNIASIKMLISELKNISCEMVHLYIYEKSNNLDLISNDSKKYIEINDDSENINEIYKKYKNKNEDFLNLFVSFIFNNNQVRLTIDFYQQNIEKIFLKLQTNCSLFLLKNIINNKLDESLDINLINLFFLDITELNIAENNKSKIQNHNNKFKDKITLKEIINLYYPHSNEDTDNINYKYSLHFLITLKTYEGSSEQMGINFRFNYLKEVQKINFIENAPSYCTCSDGLNLFAFCFNPKCELFNKYFVENLGYGVFDILKQIKRIVCPRCFIQKTVEVKNIGIINSKWVYSGKLKTTKIKENSSFEGDGITLDDKLYIFQEMKINSFLLKLYMEIKPYFSKNKIRQVARTKEEEELDDIALCDDLESNKINTCKRTQKFKFNSPMPTLKSTSTLGIENRKNRINTNNLQNFLKRNTSYANQNKLISEKIRIYDNESEISDMNSVKIDKEFPNCGNNAISCIEDTCSFSGGCFSLKKNNNGNKCSERTELCSIF